MSQEGMHEHLGNQAKQGLIVTLNDQNHPQERHLRLLRGEGAVIYGSFNVVT